MKSTKEKILNNAHELFNNQGVANVSLRKIASAIGISHSNLIYHFKTKNDVINALHERILTAAIEENQKLKQQKNTILNLMQSTLIGFRVLYDYRFFMLDLNYIIRINEPLKQQFQAIEQVRHQMYADWILASINNNLMRQAEFPNEYENLIKNIRIFSDYWLASAEIYNSEIPEEMIKKYVRLFLNLFYPYLTDRGKIMYQEAIVNTQAKIIDVLF